MKEIKNDIVAKYQYKDYVVYVKETNDSYEFYLQNEEYGIINLMFGVSKSDMKHFKEIVLYDIENYINNYKQDYED